MLTNQKHFAISIVRYLINIVGNRTFKERDREIS